MTKKSEKLALATFTKLIRAAETISSCVHQHLSKQGLTVSQFGVLEALYHLGPMCQRDIGAKILKTTGNITQVIDNLEKRELVERRRNDEDRRYYAIHLTPAGRQCIAAVFPKHARKITEAMAILNPDEQQLLGSLCRKFKNLKV
ncbi:MAG: MarR family transcriptional regulator [Desulfocapsaceae bacterium]|nr:MarR family transcriptional regulator [Desulfocapsaceae bacterium]